MESDTLTARLKSLAFRHAFVQKSQLSTNDSNFSCINMWHSSHFQSNFIFPETILSTVSKPNTEFYLKLSGSSTCGWSSSGCWVLFWRAPGCSASCGVGAPGWSSGLLVSRAACSGPPDRCSMFSKSSMWLTELVSLRASEPLRDLLKGFWPRERATDRAESSLCQEQLPYSVPSASGETPAIPSPDAPEVMG